MVVGLLRPFIFEVEALVISLVSYILALLERQNEGNISQGRYVDGDCYLKKVIVGEKLFKEVL